MRSLKILLTFLVASSFAIADETPQVKPLDMSKYDAMFNDLGKPRAGLSDAQINALKNPFKLQSDEVIADGNEGTNPVALGYKLMGVMGNKVKLNERWYNLGDTVGSYTLTQINTNSVILANEANQVEIKMNQGNKNVIITYK